MEVLQPMAGIGGHGAMRRLDVYDKLVCSVNNASSVLRLVQVRRKLKGGGRLGQRGACIDMV